MAFGPGPSHGAETMSAPLTVDGVKTLLSMDAATQRANWFVILCDQNGVPVPEREYQFAKPRRWRFDFAWPAQRIALEVEGGAYTKGRHTRGAGFLRDMEKYNEAGARGYRVFRTTPQRLNTSETLELLRRVLAL